MSNIRTWKDRCEAFDDSHITTHGDIQRAMQEEIDELRAELREQKLVAWRVREAVTVR